MIKKNSKTLDLWLSDYVLFMRGGYVCLSSDKSYYYIQLPIGRAYIFNGDKDLERDEMLYSQYGEHPEYIYRVDWFQKEINHKREVELKILELMIND